MMHELHVISFLFHPILDDNFAGSYWQNTQQFYKPLTIEMNKSQFVL